MEMNLSKDENLPHELNIVDVAENLPHDLNIVDVAENLPHDLNIVDVAENATEYAINFYISYYH
jgi:hypothetical protein